MKSIALAQEFPIGTDPQDASRRPSSAIYGGLWGLFRRMAPSVEGVGKEMGFYLRDPMIREFGMLFDASSGGAVRLVRR